MPKAIVIGSGFGGLGVAIRLQARGFETVIVEKNTKVGGHAYQLTKGGYVFDMGPSLITAPDIIRSVFTAAGERMENYLDLIPLDPFYRVYFHDGTYLDYNGSASNMKTQMARYNQKDAEEGYDRFMKKSKALYEAVILEGLGSSPFMTAKSMLDFTPRAIKLGAYRTSYGMAKTHFKDFRHRFMFSFHPLFIGGNPFRAPAVYQMIPYLEKEGGVWFTKGGMYSVIQALEKVFRKLGGEIKTNAEVRKILIENSHVTGVQTTHETLEADLVVSNADILHTYRDLIDAKWRKKWHNSKIDKTDVAMACFLIYMGTKKQFPKLLHHTLILSERYKPLIQDIFDKKILPDDFSMYLHAPTRTDPDMAPPGCESLYVLIPVANNLSGIDWESKKQEFADKILHFLEYDFGMEGLAQNLEVLELFTPNDFQKFRNSTFGSAWGVEPKLTQTAVFRPHNRSEDVAGLYFVGASTHPGAGVPGVLLTAETTEKVILEDFSEVA
ncbi:MAG: phytoene desaturase [Bacteroidetes Order II. Incertae sedis bacterium]|nr:phytoene desaturase [Bacteroidetes Order II. bacterium]